MNRTINTASPYLTTVFKTDHTVPSLFLDNDLLNRDAQRFFEDNGEDGRITDFIYRRKARLTEAVNAHNDIVQEAMADIRRQENERKVRLSTAAARKGDHQAKITELETEIADNEKQIQTQMGKGKVAVPKTLTHASFMGAIMTKHGYDPDKPPDAPKAPPIHKRKSAKGWFNYVVSAAFGAFTGVSIFSVLDFLSARDFRFDQHGVSIKFPIAIVIGAFASYQASNLAYTQAYKAKLEELRTKTRKINFLQVCTATVFGAIWLFDTLGILAFTQRSTNNQRDLGHLATSIPWYIAAGIALALTGLYGTQSISAGTEDATNDYDAEKTETDYNTALKKHAELEPNARRKALDTIGNSTPLHGASLLVAQNDDCRERIKTHQEEIGKIDTELSSAGDELLPDMNIINRKMDAHSEAYRAAGEISEFISRPFDPDFVSQVDRENSPLPLRHGLVITDDSEAASA